MIPFFDKKVAHVSNVCFWNTSDHHDFWWSSLLWLTHRDTDTLWTLVAVSTKGHPTREGHDVRGRVMLLLAEFWWYKYGCRLYLISSEYCGILMQEDGWCCYWANIYYTNIDANCEQISWNVDVKGSVMHILSKYCGIFTEESGDTYSNWILWNINTGGLVMLLLG